MHGIAISLNADIPPLESKFHDSSHAAAEWHYPSTVIADFPVGGEDGLGGQVPAFFHVVVDEILQQHLINVCAAATASNRPDVVDEYAQHEMARRRQRDDVRSQSKLPLSQILAGRSRY